MTGLDWLPSAAARVVFGAGLQPRCGDDRASSQPKPPAARAPAGGCRAGEAPHCRYLRRDDFRIRAPPAGGASIRAGLSDGDGHGCRLDSARHRSTPRRQWRSGPRRRDRRLPLASQSHPGCAVVPAALAAGEEHGTDAFLRAVTLGYDVGTRVTMAMGGVEFRNQSHRARTASPGVQGGGRRVAPASTLGRCCAGLHRAAVIRHRRLAA